MSQSSPDRKQNYKSSCRKPTSNCRDICSDSGEQNDSDLVVGSDWSGLIDEADVNLPSGFIFDVIEESDEVFRNSKIKTGGHDVDASLDADKCKLTEEKLDNRFTPNGISGDDHGLVDSAGPLVGADEWLGFEEYDGIEEEEYENWAELQFTPKSKIDSTDRAAQKGTEVALSFDLDDEMRGLVTDAFEVWGWNATKRAIEQQIIRGLTAGELRIGIAIRQLWELDHLFGISLSPLGKLNNKNHRKLKWETAISIGRAFNSYPDIDEVEIWLYDNLDTWRSSKKLQLKYSSFKLFLEGTLASSFNNFKVSPISIFIENNDFGCYDFDDGSGVFAIPQHTHS